MKLTAKEVLVKLYHEIDGSIMVARNKAELAKQERINAHQTDVETLNENTKQEQFYLGRKDAYLECLMRLLLLLEFTDDFSEKCLYIGHEDNLD